MFMNAGEDAEDILVKRHLLRADGTSIQISGAQIDNNTPEEVIRLLNISHLSDE